MKILFLDQFSELGGAQRTLLDLIPAVAERGWSAHALLPPAKDSNDHTLYSRLRQLGVPVEEISCGPYRSGPKSGSDVARFAADVRKQMIVIRRALAHDSFDLIYVNGPRLLPAVALAAARRIPILFHAHSLPDSAWGLRLARWGVRRTNATVVSCSRYVSHAFQGCVLPGRSHAVSNGTPDLDFLPRRNSREKPWRIGILGRIAREKGQKDFLEAAVIIRKAMPDTQFVICGASLFSERCYQEEVRALAQHLSGNQPVEFLDWQSDIGPVLHSLDMLAIPSHHEGQSRVLLEAFSAGVPVVAYPVGGIPESLSDGFNGFLTAATTPQALAARMLEVIAIEPPHLHQIIRNARLAWEQSHTVALFQRRLTAVMEVAAEARQAAPEIVLQQSRR